MSLFLQDNLLLPLIVQGLQLNVTPAKPTLVTSDFAMFQQPIEGQKIAEFLWGSADAKNAVLRFEMHTSQTGGGTYGLCVRNTVANRSFLAKFTIPQAVWTEVSIPIPGETTGSWPVDAGASMVVQFAPVAGPSMVGPGEGWQTSSYAAPPGCTNGAAVVAIHYYKKVGLYLDPYKTGVAPPFVVPSYSDELARCQRYWYKGANIKGACVGTAAFNEACMEHPVQMRIKPVVALSGSVRVHDVTNTPTVTSISANQSNRWGLALNSPATPLVAGRSAVQINEPTIAYYNVSARM